MPVVIPTGVQVEINGANIGVKGPKGEMKRTFSH
jgi:ribosomal protein L6P/L9E